jgi:hypothetical protein
MKLLLLIAVLFSFNAYGQDDLLKALDSAKEESDFTIATFKGTRIINGHSAETKPKGTLEFIFSHRFGRISGGWYTLYGLDDAFVRIGLDYGITDRLSVSVGRNSINKTLDGYVKYKVLRQKTGADAFPFTVTTMGGVAYNIYPKANSDIEGFETVDRLAYTGQALIAKKFNAKLSLQLMPTFIHKNAVDHTFDKNNQFAIGGAGRYKLTKGTAITAEYYYNVDRIHPRYYDAIGFGFDIETGGHVFQLVFTNAVGLTERAFITETRDEFWNGDIHFGFNVTRTFQLKKDKKGSKTTP